MPHGRSSLCLLVYACLGSAAACGRGAAPAGTTDTDVAPVPVLAAGSCLTRFPNAAGVGLGCSAKGNQCVGSPAPFCSADFTTLTEAFCTRPCAADADCGTDALCLGDPNGATTVRACVPAPCLDTLRETPGGGLGLPTDANGVAAQGCPPAKANAQGVGRACTKGGNQCVGTGAAYCTVDYTPTPQAFCTKPCGGTPECGAGATCVADPSNPLLRACIPNACLAKATPPTAPASTPTPPPALSCLPPHGTARGVGEPCTARGGQCQGQPAGTCTADVISGAPAAFCTMACLRQGDCGPQATCVSGGPLAPALRVCLPNACLN